MTEKIHRNYGDDLHSECIVFNVRNTKHKQLDSNNLQREFNGIVKTMRENEITHFFSPKFDDSIQIVDDDDDDDDIDLQSAQSDFENQSLQRDQSGFESPSFAVSL